MQNCLEVLYKYRGGGACIKIRTCQYLRGISFLAQHMYYVTPFQKFRIKTVVMDISKYHLRNAFKDILAFPPRKITSNSDFESSSYSIPFIIAGDLVIQQYTNQTIHKIYKYNRSAKYKVSP